MANTFLSTAVTIGDNCFFASHCVVEHHGRIGNHCAFGPRTTTSGAINVGDRVKTGMSVSIEPYITIGANSLIASGCVITGDIPANSLVKAQLTHSTHNYKRAG
jgi:acetyltransferase-like isoleucine patch superfamily enzyme